MSTIDLQRFTYSHHKGSYRHLAAIFLLGVVVSTAFGLDSSSRPLEADKVKVLIQRSADVMDRNWNRQSEYEFSETDLQQDGSSKTFKELMILGTRYEHLVSINDKPLTAAQLEEENRKLLRTIAQRRAESEPERKKRLDTEQRSLDRDHAMLRQMAQAMDFSYIGEQELDGHEVYVIRATPKPGYRPPTRELEVLTGMQGQLWIDKKSLSWVRVEAQVVKPVLIGGFLARVEPGTRFELDMVQVADSVWLPKHYSMKARAKILLLVRRESHEDERYFEYQQASQY